MDFLAGVVLLSGCGGRFLEGVPVLVIGLMVWFECSVCARYAFLLFSFGLKNRLFGGSDGVIRLFEKAKTTVVKHGS